MDSQNLFYDRRHVVVDTTDNINYLAGALRVHGFRCVRLQPGRGPRPRAVTAGNRRRTYGLRFDDNCRRVAGVRAMYTKLMWLYSFPGKN